MIRIVGVGGRGEREAAESLKRLILDFWPTLETDVDSDVRILVNVNCTGQKVEDLDLVVLAVFSNPPELKIPALDGSTILDTFLLGSLCAVIEVKTHRRDSVDLSGDVLNVKYKGDWHDATYQNRQQMHALIRYLEHRGLTAPHVYKFIWLRNVTRQELAHGRLADSPLPHNLLCSDSTWGNLLTSLWTDWRAKYPNTELLHNDKLFISSDRPNVALVDFNSVSRVLCGEEMTVQPARASHVVHSPRQTIGSRTVDPSRPFVTERNSYARRRNGISLWKFVRSVPAFLALVLVVGLGSAITMKRLSDWTRGPALQQRTPLNFAAFPGRYKCQRKSERYTITVTSGSDRLYASSDRGSVELLPVGENEFRAPVGIQELRGKFIFSRNSKGRIVSLTHIPEGGPRLLCSRSD